MTQLIVCALCFSPVLLPLIWRNLRDRQRERADSIRADIGAVVNRVIGGESMIAVRVEPSIRWRPGRVLLSVPGGYEFLIAAVARTVIERLPSDYELVVPGAAVCA